MSKLLKFIEYSLLDKTKIPIKEDKEFEVQSGNSIYRSSVIDENDIYNNDEPVYNIDNILNILYDESKVDEKIINLDDVLVYDDFNMENDDQKLFYVYQCPICLSVYISPESDLDICSFCENVKFPPEVIGLLNSDQIEEIDLDNYVIKDNEDE